MLKEYSLEARLDPSVKVFFLTDYLTRYYSFKSDKLSGFPTGSRRVRIYHHLMTPVKSSGHYHPPSLHVFPFLDQFSTHRIFFLGGF
jgi:hypothetical protein